MLHRIKQHIPPRGLQAYHFLLAHLAALVYRYPSQRMTVIGVTGTNGKSSTVQLIGQLLMACGYTVGWTSTDSWRIADRVIRNGTFGCRFSLRTQMSPDDRRFG